MSLDPLSEIAKKHDCGKYVLCNYTPFYNIFFEPFRYDSFNLFEIGIADGHSIRTWLDYFPNAKIYGIDIDLKAKELLGHRSFLFDINQANTQALEELMQEIGSEFRIICDDGSHRGEDIIASLSVLHKYLAVDGFYIIEDILPKEKKIVSDYIDKLLAQDNTLHFVLKTIDFKTPVIEMWMLRKSEFRKNDQFPLV